MIEVKKIKASSIWVGLIALAILACLGGVIYTVFMIQRDAGEEGVYRDMANDLRLQAQRIVSGARETGQGSQGTFDRLYGDIQPVRTALGQLEGVGMDAAVADIRARWESIQQAAPTLVNAGPRIVFIHGVSGELEQNIRPIQSEFAAVVDILLDEAVPVGTTNAAQRTLWLTERIARNIDKILAGGAESQRAADEFRTDAADFNRTIEALRNGSEVMGIQRIADPDAIDAINA
ncbi:MAG: hypothetical protein ACK5HY_07335, partial [Parahaliea sp.]